MLPLRHNTPAFSRTCGDTVPAVGSKRSSGCWRKQMMHGKREKGEHRESDIWYMLIVR